VETSSQAPAQRQKRRLRLATVLAAALFVGIVVCGPQVTDNPELNNALMCSGFFAAFFSL